MRRFSHGLQLVVLAPVLALMIVAGAALYMLVLRTVGDYADESIRANQDSLASGAFAIVDAEYDQQTYEGKLDDPRWTLLFKLNARISFEDFAREQEIGLIVETGGAVDFATGLTEAEADTIRQLAPTVGAARLSLPGGGEYYARPITFAPWEWRIILVKDASAFEALVGEVRIIYFGSGALLLLVTLGLVVWLRQMLVRPISGIARDFVEGREPTYRGIRELEDLSDSIGQMKRDLEARTLHLETTLESMSDAITVFDPEMKLVAWNEQFVHLYRYPPGFVHDGLSFEGIMRYNIERGDYGEVDPDAHLTSLVKRARNLDPPRFEVDREDGISIEIRRAHMPDGGFVTAYSDVTDRKQAVKAELAQRKAEEMTMLKTRFFAIMSHELRDPINSIFGYLGLVIRKTEDQLPKQQVENLRLALTRCDSLKDLTNDFLDLIKLEARRMEIHITEFAFDRLVNECAQMVEPSAREKDLKVSTKIEAGLKMRSDADHLRKILNNLLSNAVKFTNSGTVEVSAMANGRNLLIEVTDTGVGIEPEHIQSVFDEFDQAGRQPGGTGLGLSISRELAHLLGGEIALESQPGKGSTFTVTVPREYKESEI